MSNIQVGDTVEWNRAVDGKYLCGIVSALLPTVAVVYLLDPPGERRWPSIAKLRRVPAVADASAQGFSALTDDYADVMQRWAGSLASGVMEP